MYIEFNLQPLSWSRKPSSEDVRHYIKPVIHTFIRRFNTLDFMDIFANAIERGQTFTPGVLTGSKADTWKSQQILCADIDNGEHITEKTADGIKRKKFVPASDPMTPEEALEVMSLYNIEPYLMYYSFSHATEGQTHGVDKFRIVLILDKPITDAEVMKSYNERFAAIFNDKKNNVADNGVHNLDRLFFGSYPGSVFYRSRKITSVASLDYLPKTMASHTENKPTNCKDNKPVARSLVPNGSFNLLECLDYIDPDDRETWLKVGMALKHEGYSFDEWDTWASLSLKHDFEDSLRVWKSFSVDGSRGSITGAYITNLAKQNGYIPPSKRPGYVSNSKPLSWDDYL